MRTERYFATIWASYWIALRNDGTKTVSDERRDSPEPAYGAVLEAPECEDLTIVFPDRSGTTTAVGSVFPLPDVSPSLAHTIEEGAGHGPRGDVSSR
jgi:hypothetical protein